MTRLFTAIRLPDSIREELATLQGRPAHYRWIAPDNLHLTLVFLGEVPNDRIEAVMDALDRVPVRPMHIAIRGLGSFGPHDNPRVLWAGVEPTPELATLEKSIRRALRGLVPLEKRRFIPHITLARSRPDAPGHLHPYLETRSSEVDFAFDADEFVLMRSHLRPEGAHYSVECAYPGF